MKISFAAALCSLALWFAGDVSAEVGRQEVAHPFPESAVQGEGHLKKGIIKPNLSQAELNSAVLRYYGFWKRKYLKPSRLVRGDYKIAFDHSGATVSEAMGYGMLITVMMAGADPHAKEDFDGLDRFRKRYPSDINPAFMAWRIPANEKKVKTDSATDGDMDMALALLMAHRQWGDDGYLREARVLIKALGESLVRPDCSLRLGDWDTESSGMILTRPSDFMPTHFRAFGEATGDDLWDKVETHCDDILDELQKKYAPATGLIPDFAQFKNGHWQPAHPKALEGPHDGEYSYNACRVPWRLGWSAAGTGDLRAQQIVRRFMGWVTSTVDEPDDFKAGYSLGGKCLRGANFDSAAFISPTGVAAMSTGQQLWCDQTFAYAENQKEGYYEDAINLLCLLIISGNAWLP